MKFENVFCILGLRLVVVSFVFTACSVESKFQLNSKQNKEELELLVRMEFIKQPSVAGLGETIGEVQVQLFDGNDEPLSDYFVSIQLKENEEGASLGGTRKKKTSDEGIATFSDLVVDRYGDNFRLLAALEHKQYEASNSFAVTPCLKEAETGSFSAGNGTEASPFMICTAEQLGLIGNSSLLMSAHFQLAADIELGEAVDEWNGNHLTIGSEENPFQGNFDGRGRTIVGFETLSGSGNRSGFFSHLGEGAQVKRVRFRNVDFVTDYPMVGALAQNCRGASLEAIDFEGSVKTESTSIAGLIYRSRNCSYRNLSVDVSVEGAGLLAGVIARLEGGDTFKESSIVSRVSGSGSFIGGVIGYVLRGNHISDIQFSTQINGGGGASGTGGFASVVTSPISRVMGTVEIESDYQRVGGFASSLTGGAVGSEIFITGTVRGQGFVGGVLGVLGGYLRVSRANVEVFASGNQVGGLVGNVISSGVLQDSFASGKVSGANEVGGLVGLLEGYLSNSYSITEVLGEEKTGGLVGENEGGHALDSFWSLEKSGQESSAVGVGRTDVQMRSPATFIDWDFDQKWVMDSEKGYPKLSVRTEVCDSRWFQGGEGSLEKPFKIASFSQLKRLRELNDCWQKHFELVSDIDLFGRNFQLNLADQGLFQGTFNGNGYAIKNWKVDFPYGTPALFISVYPEGEIRNLKINDFELKGRARVTPLAAILNGKVSGCELSGEIHISSNHAGGVTTELSFLGVIEDCVSKVDIHASNGSQYLGLIGGSLNDGEARNLLVEGRILGDPYRHVGGIAGSVNGLQLSNAHADVEITGRDHNIGGLIGSVYHSTYIDRVSSRGSVTVNYASGRNVGGLLGYLSYSSILEESFSTADVLSGGQRTGGLVGYLFEKSEIHNSYATGSAQSSQVGALVGYANRDTKIVHSYGTGRVSGTSAGGLAGLVRTNSEVVWSFWDVDSTEQTSSEGQGAEGAIGLTSEQMEDPTEFSEWALDGPEAIWYFPEEGPPQLAWELE
jgi:hypothetical protein